jgi:hypothetical protein
MTGKDLIEAIKCNNLENREIREDSELKFVIDKQPFVNGDVDYLYLWLHDDYFQDVLMFKSGEISYGVDEDEKAWRY